MVDQLKKSLDDLEPPACGRCCKPMKWFSAQLMVQPADVIEHTFFCPTCGGSTKINTRFIPPTDESDAGPENAAHCPSLCARASAAGCSLASSFRLYEGL